MIKHPLQADNVKKVYNNKLVVDLNLNVKRNEVLGLVGKNGSGKTTTLNMLAGVLQPDSGTIYVNNSADIAKHPDLKAQVSYLTEEKPDLDGLTVIEYLKFIADIYNSGSTVLDNTLEKLNLKKLKNNQFSDLSKGMKQKVLFAGILIADTPILILDEMTDGLDPSQQKFVFDTIKKIKDEKTIVMASHNMQELVNLCDRICVIENGQIIKEIETSEVSSFDKFAELLK